MSQPQSTTLDGLPKRFVYAMRTLFDIMDDKKTGYVRFADIENRWQDDGTAGIPKGVVECLQKVTPSNGLLSFERFCAGLKICLLRNQVEHHKGSNKAGLLDLMKAQPKRPPSAPLLDNAEPVIKSSWTNTATVRPNNAISGQRTTSMPQLHSDRKENYIPDMDARNYPPPPAPHINQHSGAMLYGPPKPPRSSAVFERNPLNINQDQNVHMDRMHSLPDRNMDKAEIRTALQNWHMGVMMHDQELNKGIMGYSGNAKGRSSGDGKPSGHPEQVPNPHKKLASRRREPRRHTLQNGIDYNMLKRIKQIEQEKDVLMQGLTAVDRAREWYLKQVATVQEKMKYLGRVGSHMEQWSEAHAEKLELQKARVLEVNRHLAALTESWERGGLPLHMNLAVHPAPTDILARVKHQNHLLTKEVSQKSERITLLEQEKAALLRELYQTRALLQSRSQGEMILHDKMGFM